MAYSKGSCAEASYSIVVPAYNEQRGICRTLTSIAMSTTDMTERGEIIVVANACQDETAKEARTWFGDHGASLPMECNVIEQEEPGKLSAVNTAISVARGTKIIQIDADVTVDQGGIGWIVRALDNPNTQLSGLCHAVDESYLPSDKFLATIVMMGSIRRQAMPERLTAYGGCMAWNREVQLDRPADRFFPSETAVPDDMWLSRAINYAYGKNAINISRSFFVRYISPQNWLDYYAQQRRYQTPDALVDMFFPDYATATDQLIDQLEQIQPEASINEAWRELCLKRGIDFDAALPWYKEILKRVRSGKNTALEQLVAVNGIWQQVATARIC